MDINELDQSIFDKVEKIKSHHSPEDARMIEKAFRYDTRSRVSGAGAANLISSIRSRRPSFWTIWG